MTRPRLLLAAAVAVAALFAAALPVGAGQAVTLDDEIVCNTTTGEYDLTFTLTNMTSDEGNITVNTFQVDGTDTPLSFSPDPVPGGGATSVATTSVPGTTTAIFLDIEISFPDSTTGANFESTLDGDCEGIPTTTTTSTTVAPTTTAPATPPAVAVAARPAFTG
jgi:hypothetical protein